MCDKYFYTEFYTDLPYVPLHRVLHRVIICHLHRVLHRVLHRFEIRPSTQSSTQICFMYFYAEIYTELLYVIFTKFYKELLNSSHCTLYLYDICQKSTNKTRKTDEIYATKQTKVIKSTTTF